MTAGTYPDMWQELCLIGIRPEGGSEIQFAGATEDITAMDWMEKPMSGIQLVNGGHAAKYEKNTDESITMKVYPIKADDGATDSFVQLFHPQATPDSTQPIMVANTITRKKFGLILLWAEKLPDTAGAIPEAGKTAYRIQCVNAYITNYSLDYSEKVLSAELTFKWTPFTKAAVGNKREESTNGSVQLPAAITTATGF